MRLPGGQYSWQWRCSGKAAAGKAGGSNSRPSEGGGGRHGGAWQQRRQSAAHWQPEEGGSGGGRGPQVPPGKQSSGGGNSGGGGGGREADLARLHVCEHASRLQLFGGGGDKDGASLFFTDDGSVALQAAATPPETRGSGVSRAVPRPTQFLHVSLQLPVAQRVAWATLLLPSAGNTCSVAHRHLSPDLIEMVGRQVMAARGCPDADASVDTECFTSSSTGTGTASSTSSNDGGGEDKDSQTTRGRGGLESPAVAKAPAVRAVVERLWKRSCWWSDFYRQQVGTILSSAILVLANLSRGNICPYFFLLLNTSA